MNEISAPIDLPILSLQVYYGLDDRLTLSNYPGSAWRGAFGHALKKTVCVNRGVECDTCLLNRSCAYPSIFNTTAPQGSGKMTRYETVPVPYLLNIEVDQRAGEYVLGITLIGDACRHLPYVIYALAEAGRHGIGSRRQPLERHDIRQFDFVDNSWFEI